MISRRAMQVRSLDIPAPRKPTDDPVAALRRRLVSTTSTAELRRRLQLRLSDETACD